MSDQHATSSITFSLGMNTARDLADLLIADRSLQLISGATSKRAFAKRVEKMTEQEASRLYFAIREVRHLLRRLGAAPVQVLAVIQDQLPEDAIGAEET
jgi:hypothetical protein